MNDIQKIKNLFSLFITAFAVVSIWSFFNNDSSKIISKEGRKVLSDKERMDTLRSKIDICKKNEESSSDIII